MRFQNVTKTLLATFALLLGIPVALNAAAAPPRCRRPSKTPKRKALSSKPATTRSSPRRGKKAS